MKCWFSSRKNNSCCKPARWRTPSIKRERLIKKRNLHVESLVKRQTSGSTISNGSLQKDHDHQTPDKVFLNLQTELRNLSPDPQPYYSGTILFATCHGTPQRATITQLLEAETGTFLNMSRSFSCDAASFQFKQTKTPRIFNPSQHAVITMCDALHV